MNHVNIIRTHASQLVFATYPHVLREALTAQQSPATPETLARLFTRARKDRVEELLQTLVTMGQAREDGAGKYLPPRHLSFQSESPY